MSENELMSIVRRNMDKIERLVEIGVLNYNDMVRGHNIGVSNYSKRVLQPWSIWLDWNLDPWAADIVKRIGREKEGETDKMRYEKIIHICQEKLRQIELSSKKK